MNDFLEYFDLTWGGLAAGIAKIAVMLVLMLVAVKLVKTVFGKLERSFKEKNPDAPADWIKVLSFAVRAILYFVFIMNIFYAIPGLESLMTTLLAGSGVAALVVSFAAQDAVNNLVSGFLIQVFKPFVVGDAISCNGMSGVVEEIGLRQTVIRTLENRRVIIPNGVMNSSVVENSSYGERDTAFEVEAGITYESDENRAIELMAEAISSCPAFVDRRSDADRVAGVPAVTVRLSRLDDSAVVLSAWVWAPSPAEVPGIRSELLLAVKSKFEAGGVSMAYPHVVVVSGDK